jgi:hypothetical protein
MRLKPVDLIILTLLAWVPLSIWGALTLMPTASELQASATVSTLLVSVGGLIYVEYVRTSRESNKASMADINRWDFAGKTPAEYASSLLADTDEERASNAQLAKVKDWATARKDLRAGAKLVHENTKKLFSLIMGFATIQLGTALFLLLVVNPEDTTVKIAFFFSVYSTGAALAMFLYFLYMTNIIIEVGVVPTVREDGTTSKS